MQSVEQILAARKKVRSAEKRKLREGIQKSLETLGQQLKANAELLLAQSAALSAPPKLDLIDELLEGPVIYLGSDPWDEEAWMDSIVFEEPNVAPPAEDYDPAKHVLVDFWQVKLRVDITFKAYGYKCREKKNFKSPEPFQHLPQATAKIPFSVSKISTHKSLEDWVEDITEWSFYQRGSLENEEVDIDHHYPTKGRGTGHVHTTICLLRIRQS